MRRGMIESNLRTLNAEFRLSHIDDLIARKVAGRDTDPLHANLHWHETELNRLCAELDAARDASQLPAEPMCQEEMDDLLVRVRLKHIHF